MILNYGLNTLTAPNRVGEVFSPKSISDLSLDSTLLDPQREGQFGLIGNGKPTSLKSPLSDCVMPPLQGVKKLAPPPSPIFWGFWVLVDPGYRKIQKSQNLISEIENPHR